MDKDKIKIGDLITAQVKEDMEAPFTGLIEKIYENSCLVTIQDFDQKDKTNVVELNNKLVVSLKNIKAASGEASSKKAKA